MPNKIAANFEYQSKRFLDNRQNKARTKEDLKNWKDLVPEGFKTCLNQVWYYYDSSVDLTETGHWVPALIDELDNVTNEALQSPSTKLVGNLSKTINGVNNDLKTLDNKMYPTTINSVRAEVEGSSNSSSQYTVEVGDSIIPKLSWKVIKPLVKWTLDGSSVKWSIVPGSENNSIDVESSKVTGLEGTVGEDNLSWVSSEVLTSNVKSTKVINIESTTSSGEVLTDTAKFAFYYKRWTGVGDLDIWDLDTIRPQDISFTGSFTNSGYMGNTVFNCSGGKYPYILIPVELYNSSKSTYVNNNLNSDFLIKDVTVINNFGVEIPYKIYRTNYIQTGNSLLIKID